MWSIGKFDKILYEGIKMALTELQLPDKISFYRDVQSVAGQITAHMIRWREMREFLAVMSTEDLDAIGVAAGQVRIDLIDFRVALDELIKLYEGSAVTPTNNPEEIMDCIRRMLVI